MNLTLEIVATFLVLLAAYAVGLLGMVAAGGG